MLRFMPKRISSQIRLLAVAPVVTLAAFLTYNTISERRQDAREALNAQAEAFAQVIADGSRTSLISDNAQYVAELTENIFKRPDVMLVRIVKANGQILLEKTKPAVSGAASFSASRDIHQVAESLEPLADGDPGVVNSRVLGTVQVATTDAVINARLLRNLAEDGVISSVAIAAVLWVSIFLSRRLTRRLDQTSDVVRDITRGMYRRIDGDGDSDDEVGLLAKNINSMIGTMEEAQIEIENHLQALVAARDDADRANAEKRAFLGQISSEISSPLHEINIHLQSLLDECVLPAQRHQIDMALYHVDYLHGLYEDLMEFYLQNTNRLSVHRRFFNIPETIGRILSPFQEAAGTKGITLRTELSGPLELQRGFIHNDPIRFRQVLHELVSNAVRYTFSGEVEVHAHFRASSNDQIVVTVEVIDSGVGISADMMPVIFEKLQGHAPYDIAHGETTGLLIAGRTAQVIGGALTVRSRSGAGSVFTFELPSRFSDTRTPLPVVTPTPGDSGDVVRVLFATLNPASQRGVAELLGLAVKVDVAIGTDPACRKLQGNIYDVILAEGIDAEDGLQFAEKLRKADTQHITPVIAIVDRITPEVLAEAERCGVNHLLAPPLRRYDIYRKIAQCTQLQRSLAAIFTSTDRDQDGGGLNNTNAAG